MVENLQKNSDKDYKKSKDYIDLFIKIEPAATINLEHVKSESKDWDFFYNTQKMLSSKELDMLMDKVKSSRLPDMFYGYNRFYIANAKKDFLLEIDPIQMIDLCNYNERNSRYINISENKPLSEKNIYYIPNEIKVQFYDKWKNIKVDRDDIQKKDPTSDWSFSTPYIGNVMRLKNHKIYAENLEKFQNHFDILNINDVNSLEIKEEMKDSNNSGQENEKVKINGNFRIESTTEELPLTKLGRDNPILHYMEVNLFDDELNDNGLAQGNLR